MTPAALKALAAAETLADLIARLSEAESARAVQVLGPDFWILAGTVKGLCIQAREETAGLKKGGDS